MANRRTLRFLRAGRTRPAGARDASRPTVQVPAPQRPWDPHGYLHTLRALRAASARPGFARDASRRPVQLLWRSVGVRKPWQIAVRCGSCAPAAHDLPALATLLARPSRSRRRSGPGIRTVTLIRCGSCAPRARDPASLVTLPAAPSNSCGAAWVSGNHGKSPYAAVPARRPHTTCRRSRRFSPARPGPGAAAALGSARLPAYAAGPARRECAARLRS